MAVTADHIRTTLHSYLEEHPEEKPGLAIALELLDAGADLSSRKEFRGHATAGAILVGPDGRILHIHHLATGKWLLPGGHLESTDTSLGEAARRELTEETGILADSVSPVGDSPSTSTSIRSMPTPPRPSRTTSTSTSGFCSAPKPKSADSRPKRSSTPPGASSTASATYTCDAGSPRFFADTDRQSPRHSGSGPGPRRFRSPVRARGRGRELVPRWSGCVTLRACRHPAVCAPSAPERSPLSAAASPAMTRPDGGRCWS